MHSEYFADQLRILASLENIPAADRVLDAFMHVPRELFAGPGPWKVRSPLAGSRLPVRETPDDDPRWLYHSVLVVLNEEKGINIGDPGLWARLLTQADIKPGSRILQVGAGVGYYTAILSRLAGPAGQVIAYEVESELAERAAANLADWSNTEVRHGNAATNLEGTDAFDFVISFAGVTHIPSTWASRLAPDARLLLPLTGENWLGAMILAHQSDKGFSAVTLGRCGFYPCAGARNGKLAAQVTKLFSDPGHLKDWHLRITDRGGLIRLEADAA